MSDNPDQQVPQEESELQPAKRQPAPERQSEAKKPPFLPEEEAFGDEIRSEVDDHLPGEVDSGEIPVSRETPPFLANPQEAATPVLEPDPGVENIPEWLKKNNLHGQSEPLPSPAQNPEEPFDETPSWVNELQGLEEEPQKESKPSGDLASTTENLPEWLSNFPEPPKMTDALEKEHTAPFSSVPAFSSGALASIPPFTTKPVDNIELEEIEQTAEVDAPAENEPVSQADDVPEELPAKRRRPPSGALPAPEQERISDLGKELIEEELASQQPNKSGFLRRVTGGLIVGKAATAAGQKDAPHTSPVSKKGSRTAQESDISDDKLVERLATTIDNQPPPSFLTLSASTPGSMEDRSDQLNPLALPGEMRPSSDDEQLFDLRGELREDENKAALHLKKPGLIQRISDRLRPDREPAEGQKQIEPIIELRTAALLGVAGNEPTVPPVNEIDDETRAELNPEGYEVPEMLELEPAEAELSEAEIGEIEQQPELDKSIAIPAAELAPAAPVENQAATPEPEPIPTEIPSKTKVPWWQKLAILFSLDRARPPDADLSNEEIERRLRLNAKQGSTAPTGSTVEAPELAGMMPAEQNLLPDELAWQAIKPEGEPEFEVGSPAEVGINQTSVMKSEASQELSGEGVFTNLEDEIPTTQGSLLKTLGESKSQAAAETGGEEFPALRQIALEDYELLPLPVELPKSKPLNERVFERYHSLSAMQKTLLGLFALADLALILIIMFATIDFVIGALFPVSVAPRPPAPSPTIFSGYPIPVQLVMPGGWTFEIKEGVVKNGQWNPQGPEWLRSTEIRRWIALEWSRHLVAVFIITTQGDPVEIVMSNGDHLQYVVQSVQEVPIERVADFNVNEPGLVVVLANEGAPTRWVLLAVPAEVPSGTPTP